MSRGRLKRRTKIDSFAHRIKRLSRMPINVSFVLDHSGSMKGDKIDRVRRATALDEVAYARIDLRTGNLTAAGWSMNVSRLKKQVSKETTVIAGGNALVTGGLYNGDRNGSTEESYAQLNPDGSTSSFNGATGTNTIQALGGGNLFNHAAVGYVDGRGVFHVLVAGGDDVNTPATKHAGVYFY